MTAKEKLSQLEKTKRLIGKLDDEIITLRANLVQDGIYNQTASITAKIISLEKIIYRYMDHLVDLEQGVLEIIEQIPDLDAQCILIGRYISMKSIADIAKEFGHGARWVYSLHKKALQDFDQIMASRDRLTGAANAKPVSSHELSGTDLN